MPPEEEPQAPPPPNTEPTEAAPGEAEDEPQTLEQAQELFDRGSKAIEDEDFVDAVDCLSRALEIRLGFPFPFPFPPLYLGDISCEATPRVGRVRSNWRLVRRFFCPDLLVFASVLVWLGDSVQ